MKIGIITFHRAANYGAVLQAYALQSYLQEKQQDAEIVDYRCKAIERVYSPFYFLYVKGMKAKLKQLFRFPVKFKKRRLFNRFLREELTLSNSISAKQTDTTAWEKYDALIAGSDQIWNPDLTGRDGVYLLDFNAGRALKMSYAASFGLDALDDRDKEYYKKCIHDFAALSVRERQGARLLRELCEKEIDVVIDPTLLIRSEVWERFLTPAKYRNYVLLYMIKYNEALVEAARKLAAEKGMQVVFISDSMVKKPGVTYVKYATPQEWVGLFHDADYVVTNSFHGTAFSINFNKRVLIGLSREARNGNSRILDLLQDLDVEIETSSDIIDLQKNVEWSKINLALDKLRKHSCLFLEAVRE